MSSANARAILAAAEEVCAADEIDRALQRLAGEITAALAERHPLVLAVMGGAVVFAGNLLPKLAFPLEFDFLHVTRYNDTTRGGQLDWRVSPDAKIPGRCVLVVDDVLDEGITLAAIKMRMLELGASACYTAVMVEKELGRKKPISADFVGLTLPNRYLFGYGMDVEGAWRNLPAIYALK